MTPHPGNARTHSKRQTRQIADSIDEFGFNNPIIVDGCKTVVAGHGRLEAARLRGMERVCQCFTLRHHPRWQRYTGEDAVHAVTGESFNERTAKLEEVNHG